MHGVFKDGPIQAFEARACQQLPCNHRPISDYVIDPLLRAHLLSFGDKTDREVLKARHLEHAVGI